MERNDSSLSTSRGASIARIHRAQRGVALPLLLTAFLTACGDKPCCTPTPPDLTLQSSPSTTPRLSAEGPAEVPPGTSASFRALVTNPSDGSVRDVSQEAQWVSKNPSVLSISAGFATGHTAGEAVITVEFEGQKAGKQVLVVPAGTYRVKGGVVVDGLDQTIDMASVQVPEAGLATTTSAGGFVLYGVPSSAEYRVAKDGFEPITQRHTVAGHDTYLRISMRPLAATPDVSATYRLTVGGGACGSGTFPAELAQRTYTAVVVQNGSSMTVKLSGARFHPSPGPPFSQGTGDTFSGVINAIGSRFTLDFPSAYDENSHGYADIVERLPDGRLLVLLGYASATYSASGFTGTFNGRFSVYDSNDPFLHREVAYCFSSAHTFILAR